MTKENMAMRRVDDPQEVGAPFTFLVPIIQTGWTIRQPNLVCAEDPLPVCVG